MKYDRPVWQLMHACADDLPNPFRFTDVRAWFAEHFPEVGDSTMRAHVVGLTEGGAAKQPQFQLRSPLFRRVSRGVYSVIPLEERGESPDDDDSSVSGDGVTDHQTMVGRTAEYTGSPDFPESTPAEIADEPAGAPDAPKSDSDTEPGPSKRGRFKRWRASRKERRATEASAGPSDDENPDTSRTPHITIASTVPERSTTESPEADASGAMSESVSVDATATPLDAILVGSGRERVVVPVPAKDAFRDRTFQRNRREAERSEIPWFLVTPDHGLLEPDEWVTPHDGAPAEVRDEAWASWIAAKLASVIGPLNGRTLHVSADAALADPLVDVLQREGAVVTLGPVPAQRPVTAPDEARPNPVVSAVVEHLTDRAAATPAGAARGLTHQSGMYAWLVDDAGAATLSESLQLSVVAGPLYVGQVGAREGIGEISNSLNDHINLVQLYGTARSSRFRSHLATALADPLDLRSIDDARLTRWMVAHLSVAVWPVDDVSVLRDLKSSVLAEVHTPLNFERTASGVFQERIAALRAKLA